jgi:hypothetical protein
MTKLNYKTWLVVVLILLVSTAGVFAFANSNKTINKNPEVADNLTSAISSTPEIGEPKE